MRTASRTTSPWPITVALLACMAMLMPMLATAADADPLQDFCVANNATGITINGFPCKPAAEVSVKDFMSTALVMEGKITAPDNATVTPASVKEFPGLNTLGISAVRIDFAKGGINPPHTHPRATELLIVAKGELYVGFVDTTTPTPRLFATTIREGELFVFPKALVHFQLNVGKGKAMAFAALSSQNPGVQKIAPALFGSNPRVKDEVLAKGFRIYEDTVKLIEKNFPVPKN